MDIGVWSPRNGRILYYWCVENTAKRRARQGPIVTNIPDYRSREKNEIADKPGQSKVTFLCTRCSWHEDPNRTMSDGAGMGTQDRTVSVNPAHAVIMAMSRGALSPSGRARVSMRRHSPPLMNLTWLLSRHGRQADALSTNGVVQLGADSVTGRPIHSCLFFFLWFQVDSYPMGMSGLPVDPVGPYICTS